MVLTYQPTDLIPLGNTLLCPDEILTPKTNGLVPILQSLLEEQTLAWECENPQYLARWIALTGTHPEAIPPQSHIALFRDGGDGAGEDEEEDPYDGMGLLFYREDREQIDGETQITYLVHVPLGAHQQQLLEACQHLHQVDAQSAQSYRQIENYLQGVLSNGEAWTSIAPEEEEDDDGDYEDLE